MRVIVWLVVGLLAAACGSDGGTGGGIEVGADGFGARVTTDQASYATGEPVRFKVEVCYGGRGEGQSDGGGGTDIPFDFRILDSAGTVVADSSHVVRTMELRDVRWQPGQCREETSEWDQHRWNQDEPAEPSDIFGLPVVGERVPAGDYRIEVTVTPGGLQTSEPFVIEPDTA